MQPKPLIVKFSSDLSNLVESFKKFAVTLGFDMIRLLCQGGSYRSVGAASSRSVKLKMVQLRASGAETHKSDFGPLF